MANDVGIRSFGAHIPRLRLQRQAIAAANLWFNPGLRGMARGERSMANWDEDTVTMAVEAARDCLAGFDAAAVASLSLASTTHPFGDRQNTSIVAGALNLRPGVRSLDVAGSLRAGTSALDTAFGAPRGTDGAALVIAFVPTLRENDLLRLAGMILGGLGSCIAIRAMYRHGEDLRRAKETTAALR